MSELASTFEDAWTAFQARDALLLADDTLEWEWTRGRAQYLTFLVRVEDAAARAHVARVIERLAGIPGVEPYPEWYWHVTVKGGGFQVIKRAHDDDILRQDVARIASAARELLADERAYEAQLGLANGFAGVVFLEVFDGGRTRELNAGLGGLPHIAHYPGDDVFLPHVSVARFTSNDGLEQLKAALAGLRDEGPGPAFVVRRVDFIKVWLAEELEFETLATYPLA